MPLSCKLSHLSRLELQLAYNPLLDLKMPVVYKDAKQKTGTNEPAALQGLGRLDALSIEVEVGKASDMTRATKKLSINSLLPTVS